VFKGVKAAARLSDVRRGDHTPAATDADGDDERVSILPLGCWQLTTSVRDDVDNCRSLILLQHVPRRWVCLSQQAGDAEFPTGGQWSNYSIIYEGP